MTSELTGPARDELDLPTAVLHLLDIGRAQLAELRAAEAAERERKEAERREQFDAAFAPVRQAVAAVVPDALLAYVDWREAEFTAGRDGHSISLRVPGCVPLPLDFWIVNGTWSLYGGFPDATNDTGSPVPTLAVALALARDEWLQREADDREIPF